MTKYSENLNEFEIFFNWNVYWNDNKSCCVFVNMTKFYTKGATRMYSWENVEAWAKAEENLGLKNSIFFIQELYKKDYVKVEQWIDADEGEAFFQHVKRMLKKNWWFNLTCELHFKSLKYKDKVQTYKCLAIFNEIDEHPEIATEDQLRRLKRIRESTHEEIYKMSGNENTVQNNKV